MRTFLLAAMVLRLWPSLMFRNTVNVKLFATKLLVVQATDLRSLFYWQGPGVECFRHEQSALMI